MNANFLSELEGDTLSLYGPGALDALDKNWGIQAAGAVNTIIFRFIDFDEIVKQLHKVRVRFPNVHVSDKLTVKTLMSTTVDILRFYWHLYNQLLKVKCAFKFETLIYVGT